MSVEGPLVVVDQGRLETKGRVGLASGRPLVGPDLAVAVARQQAWRPETADRPQVPRLVAEIPFPLATEVGMVGHTEETA